MDISEIMTGQVVSICEDEPVIAAARLMKQYNFGAVPVRDERGRLKGIVTDRDIVLRCVAPGASQRDLRVSEIMTRNLETAAPTIWQYSNATNTQVSIGVANYTSRARYRRIKESSSSGMTG